MVARVGTIVDDEDGATLAIGIAALATTEAGVAMLAGMTVAAEIPFTTVASLCVVCV